MAVTAARVTVGSSAVALNTATTAGMTLLVKNAGGTNTANLGPSDVTDGGGYTLGTGETVTVEVDAGSVLYAISASGTDVTVLRT